MVALNLYFVRHGESEASVLKVFSNRGLKHGLTSKGAEQAASLAERLKGMKFDALYTSPLLRAIETSQILSRKLGLEYVATQALTEFDVGALEGRSDDESWELYETLVNDWLIKGKWDMSIEGGESLYDIKNRTLPFIYSLIDAYPDESNVLVVGHGGTFRCIFPMLLTNIDFAYSAVHHLNNTEYVLAKALCGQVKCIKWGDRLFE